MKKALAKYKLEEMKYSVENYVLAVFMKVDSRERELLADRDMINTVDKDELKSVYQNYYRCA